MNQIAKNPDRGTGTERKCIATGEVQPKFGLIRFVVGPDQHIVPDILGKLPGRGIWVSAKYGTLAKAVSKSLFSRGAKQTVSVPDTLISDIETQLARRVIDLISLARKSGQAVSGYEKVKDWLSKETARVLIQASDGSARGKSKLSTPYGGSFIGWLTADELGLAFGRQTAIHGALASGGLTSRIVEEAARLKGLRVIDDSDGGRGHREGKDS
ncbi:MAG: RNA-binding protein [Marinovum sp.]|nr:RNA-binding protein [Marinovum sp.]